MRKLSVGFLILSFLCLAIANPALAMKKLGQVGMTWLSISASARAAGMGGAFNNIEGDPASAFYNPAGLAYIDRGAAFFNYTQWIADMGVMDVAAFYKAGQYGIFGFSFRTVDYGTIYGTKIDEAAAAGYSDTGEIDVGAYAFGIAYARKLTDRFSLGIQLKYAGEHLGKNEAWGEFEATENKVSTADAGFPWAAFDLGFGYETGIRSLKLTASVRNFSKQLLYEDERFQLPLTFKIGLSINPLDLMPGLTIPEPHSFLLAVEGVDPRDRPEDMAVGLEYTFMDMLSVRLGRRDASQSEGGFSAGAGFKLSMAGMAGRIDYAYTNFGDILGTVNRVSLMGSF